MSGRFRAQLQSAPYRLTIALTLLLLLLRVHLFVWGDTWFNLVLGRQVAEQGVQWRDAVTAVGWGATVLDVQWLAHLVFYRVANAIGITGLVTGAAVFVVASVLMGAAFALRFGATPGRVLLATLSAFMAIGAQVVLRAQTLVYPLVILFVALLWADARRARTITWALVPLAVLWANLHGSVLLAPVLAGALLVARVLDAWRQRQRPDLRLAMRDGALVAALVAAVVVTPYGFDVWQYYRDTAGNPVFRDYVTEWYPLWSNAEPGLVALLMVVAIALLFGWRRSDSFPALVLSGLSVMLLMSVRHATPLALASIVLLPQLLDFTLGDRLPLDFGELAGGGSRAAVLGACLAFLVGVPWLAGEQHHRPGSGSLEARIAGTTYPQCLLIDEQQGDRLLWYYPQLIGRISHTVRVETIPLGLLVELGNAYAHPTTPAAEALWRRYPIVALDQRMHPEVIDALTRDTTFERMGQEGNLVAFRHRYGTRLPNACAVERMRAGRAIAGLAQPAVKHHGTVAVRMKHS